MMTFEKIKTVKEGEYRDRVSDAEKYLQRIWAELEWIFADKERKKMSEERIQKLTRAYAKINIYEPETIEIYAVY